MDFNETKPASWIEGRIPAGDNREFAHCTTLKPDIIMVQGLDPSKSKLDRILTPNPQEVLYNCFVYAFMLKDGSSGKELCKAHRMSQWAVKGNYAYVFSGGNRRYMSDRGLLENVEVGFIDLILPSSIRCYRIGEKFVLETIPV
jgi:hypothetical protein